MGDEEGREAAKDPVRRQCSLRDGDASLIMPLLLASRNHRLNAMCVRMTALRA